MRYREGAKDAKLREARLMILRVTSLLRSFAVMFLGCGHDCLDIRQHVREESREWKTDCGRGNGFASVAKE
jgi:hypothetical protein